MYFKNHSKINDGTSELVIFKMRSSFSMILTRQHFSDSRCNIKVREAVYMKRNWLLG